MLRSEEYDVFATVESLLLKKSVYEARDYLFVDLVVLAVLRNSGISRKFFFHLAG